jgi:outer membrane protein W
MVAWTMCLFGSFGVSLAANPLSAQHEPEPSHPWTFLSLARVSGQSASSDPEGYKVFSAIGLGVGLRRLWNHHLSTELSTAFESREVEFTGTSGTRTNLGSLESVPISAVVQWYFRTEGKVLPYLGAGANVTFFWEKSGVLDADDVSPSVGPVVQAGVDIALSPSVLLNIDFKWNASETDINADGTKIASIKIHPSALGLGLGFRL